MQSLKTIPAFNTKPTKWLSGWATEAPIRIDKQRRSAIVNHHLEELAKELDSGQRGTSIQYFESGNGWLPYPFVGVTRPNGSRFALYFRGDQLFYVPADSGTVRPAVPIQAERESWNLRDALDEVEDLERQFDRAQYVLEPSFAASNPKAKETSEAAHTLRFNWLLPVFSGGFLFLLLVLISVGTATSPPGGVGFDRTSNSPAPISTNQPQSPSPSSPNPLTPGSSPVTGSFDRSPGYMVICNDGTVSYSGGKRGACSWHGGVR